MTERDKPPKARASGRAMDIRALLGTYERPILLGVAGDSGSGKTTYSNGIRRLLGNDIVTSISLDGYHKEDRAQRRRSGRLPLDPAANHLDLIRSHLAGLRTGKSVEIPIYNHQTGSFDIPQVITATPVIIVEGLHALYPEFAEFLDFTLYVDSDREVKWRWKMERDVIDRGHDPDDVEDEMQRRETAYKRWIDFQKTHADVVIKIHESHLSALANQHYDGSIPDNCYHMEVIVSPTDDPLPPLHLPVDLNALTQGDAPPFMLAAVPSTYWGKRVNVMHVDGVIPLDSLQQLETEIMGLTGLHAEIGLGQPDQESNSTIRFTQSLVAWPFLGHIAAMLRGWSLKDHANRRALRATE